PPAPVSARARPRRRQSRPQCANPYADRHRSLPPSNAPSVATEQGPWRALLIPEDRRVAPLSSHTTADPVGQAASLVNQSHKTRRQAVREPNPPDLDATEPRNAYRGYSIR